MPTRYQQMTSEQKAKCHARKKRWRQNNLERAREHRRRHYLENRDKYLAQERERSYQKRYRISVADYDRMLAAQGGVCAICGADKPGKKHQRFAVDHCHKTGEVRGLLCLICNTRLGWLRWFDQHKDAIKAYLNSQNDVVW